MKIKIQWLCHKSKNLRQFLIQVLKYKYHSISSHMVVLVKLSIKLSMLNNLSTFAIQLLEYLLTLVTENYQTQSLKQKASCLMWYWKQGETAQYYLKNIPTDFCRNSNAFDTFSSLWIRCFPLARINEIKKDDIISCVQRHRDKKLLPHSHCHMPIDFKASFLKSIKFGEIHAVYILCNKRQSCKGMW